MKKKKNNRKKKKKKKKKTKNIRTPTCSEVVTYPNANWDERCLTSENRSEAVLQCNIESTQSGRKFISDKP